MEDCFLEHGQLTSRQSTEESDVPFPQQPQLLTMWDGRGLVTPSSKHDGLWTGSILCRFLMGSHSWCEFTGTMVMSHRADSVSQCYSSSSGSFFPLYFGMQKLQCVIYIGWHSMWLLLAPLLRKTQIYMVISYSHLTATFITDASQRNLRTRSFVLLMYKEINCPMTA